VTPPARLIHARGEAIAALSAGVLVALMIGLEWYGYSGSRGPVAPQAAPASAVTGWHELTSLRWLMVATAGVAVAALVARIALGARAGSAPGLAVMSLGLLSTAALSYRVLIALPGDGAISDQKLGAILGVACAVGVAYGGWESWGQRADPH
jgi:hypothetical protein